MYEDMLNKLNIHIVELEGKLEAADKKYDQECVNHFETIKQRDEYVAKYTELKDNLKVIKVDAMEAGKCLAID